LSKGYLYQTNQEAMDIALKKLDLVQRLLLIWDEAALQRVAKVIEKEAPEVDQEDDFTAEEIAELDKRRAEYLRGEGTSYTAEESLQRLRSGKR
jgi:hypothetical protein